MTKRNKPLNKDGAKDFKWFSWDPDRRRRSWVGCRDLYLSPYLCVCAPGMFVGVLCWTEKYNKWGDGPQCLLLFLLFMSCTVFPPTLTLCWVMFSISHRCLTGSAGSRWPSRRKRPWGHQGKPAHRPVRKHLCLLARVDFGAFHEIINHTSSQFSTYLIMADMISCNYLKETCHIFLTVGWKRCLRTKGGTRIHSKYNLCVPQLQSFPVITVVQKLFSCLNLDFD